MAVHHTEEQKIEIAKKVCLLYESQGATVESCCESAGITDRTFYYWMAEISEISELYKKAKEKEESIFWERLKPIAQTALERLLRGETKTETKEESGTTATGAINKTTEVVSEILPNSSVTIFTLKGLYPEKFSDKSEIKHSGSINTPDFSKLSDAELDAYLALCQKLNGGE